MVSLLTGSVAVALAVLTIATLSGCDVGPDIAGRTSVEARIVDGDLEFVTCKTTTAIYIIAEHETTPGEWSRLWDFRGQVALDPMVALNSTDLADLMEGTAEPLPASGQGLLIVAIGRDGGEVQGGFTIDELRNSRGNWVRNDGSVDELPCS